MTDEANEPDAAAARLESALERIAQLTESLHALPAERRTESAQAVTEIAVRLDQLIDRLRSVLGRGPD
jgi:hypothetical protein